MVKRSYRRLVTIYRGHGIHACEYQGTTCYYTPAFGCAVLAANLATIKRWIDQAIAAREING